MLFLSVIDMTGFLHNATSGYYGCRTGGTELIFAAGTGSKDTYVHYRSPILLGHVGLDSMVMQEGSSELGFSMPTAQQIAFFISGAHPHADYENQGTLSRFRAVVNRGLHSSSTDQKQKVNVAYSNLEAMSPNPFNSPYIKNSRIQFVLDPSEIFFYTDNKRVPNNYGI